MKPAVRFLALGLLCLAACGGAASLEHAAGQNAAVGAVDAVTTPAAERKIDALAGDAGAAFGQGAATAVEAVVFGPQTSAGIQAVSGQLRQEAVAARDALLDDVLLREVARLREEAVGAPLRADVDALIDGAAPRLAAAVAKAVQASVAPLEAKASADVARLKNVAIVLSVVLGVLLLAHAFAVWELRRLRSGGK